MQPTVYEFTSGLQRIADFLWQNINHEGVQYMNFASDTAIFEDRLNGSYIYMEFLDADKAVPSRIHYALEGPEGIVCQWVRKFKEDFAAEVRDLS